MQLCWATSAGWCCFVRLCGRGRSKLFEFIRDYSKSGCGLLSGPTGSIRSSFSPYFPASLCLFQTDDLDTTNPAGSSSAVEARRRAWLRLMARLEVVLCSLEASQYRPVCLALALLAEQRVVGLPKLAKVCGVSQQLPVSLSR
ncbi:unnamed protein product [Protopolystoma xenopodis]|uniref:Uncharacterized protein n=1 Tax=Protopolystoma xenopodis TaxID=117903 RepID=A0A3S4ZH75_9PLAT|nr:unnamed protein product [Protopolystoma xenopodis]